MIILIDGRLIEFDILNKIILEGGIISPLFSFMVADLSLTMKPPNSGKIIQSSMYKSSEIYFSIDFFILAKVKNLY